MAYIPAVASLGKTAKFTCVIPAGCAIRGIYIFNLTANAITGGLSVGTTDGGVDIVVAQAVGASAKVFVSDANLLKRIFSESADQTIFFNPVTSFNSANVDCYVDIAKLL